MYAFILGAYPPAFGRIRGAPGGLRAVHGGATLLFYAGTAVLSLGLAGAFLAESSAGGGGLLPRRVAAAGTAINVLALAQAIGLLVGVREFAVAAPSALLAFVMTAFLGLSIWRHDS